LLSFGAEYFFFHFASQKLKPNIHCIINLPVVLNGCETLSLTLREEPRLRVFWDRVLRRIFEHEKSELRGDWRKLHNEELNELYCSPNIFRVNKSRRMSWAVHVAHMGRLEVYTGFWWE